MSALGLYDINGTAAEALGARLVRYYPALALSLGSNDPTGFDIVVNATPLGMKPGDPLPLEIARLDPSTFVGEVVMAEEVTPFWLRRGRAAARCRSARTCCSSRFPPIWNSSGSPRPRPKT